MLLAHDNPWDSIVNAYLNQVNNHKTGASNMNPRIVLGSLIVKHMLNISDEETIKKDTENLYIKYFIGYESFTSKAPFDSSLFVEIHKRMGMEELNRINDVIYRAAMGKWNTVSVNGENGSDDDVNEQSPEGKGSSDDSQEEAEAQSDVSQNRGRILVDATACP